MSTINDLSVAASVASDDKFPIWQNANGVTRALPVSVLDTRYLTQDQIASLAVSPTTEIFISDTLPNPEGYPTFTAGTTHALTLSHQYYSGSNIEVHFDGGFQGEDTYTLTGFGLAFVDPDTQAFVPIPLGIEKVYVSGGAVRVVSAPSQGTVTTDSLVDLSVTTPKLADDAVTAQKLAAAAVVDASVAPGTMLYNRIHGLYIDARDYGVKADGVTDDTAAAQLAINTAGINGTVQFPAGTVLLSATLTALIGQTLLGAGRGNTVFRRFTDYGDTLVFPNAINNIVRGIWFYHGTMYGLTDIALTNRIVTNPSSAHIRLQNANTSLVEDCICWRMPYGIVIDEGSLVTINRCHSQGTWDGNFVAAQEGVAGILIGNRGYTQIVKVTDCYLAGSGNGPRNITWTSSDTGAHTFSQIQNCGNQYGIQIKQCEDLLVSGGYIGGNWNSCIYGNVKANTTNLDWRFIGVFIDGAGAAGSLIAFIPEANGFYPNGVVIASNVFNGELQTLNAILAYNPFGTAPAVAGFTITGNTFQATVGTALNLISAQGGVVGHNQIGGYNARAVTSGGDLAFCAAALIASTSSYIFLEGNIVGGSVNSAGAPSNCYVGFSYDGAPGSVVERNTMNVGTGLTGSVVGRRDARMVTKTSSGNYVCLGNEDIVRINKTVGGSTQVSLPGNVDVGYKITIKDGKGDAATNPIQVVGSVDGASNPIYNTAYVSKTLVWGGEQWNVVG